jgi:hypothetical protein
MSKPICISIQPNSNCYQVSLLPLICQGKQDILGSPNPDLSEQYLDSFRNNRIETAKALQQSKTEEWYLLFRDESSIQLIMEQLDYLQNLESSDFQYLCKHSTLAYEGSQEPIKDLATVLTSLDIDPEQTSSIAIILDGKRLSELFAKSWYTRGLGCCIDIGKEYTVWVAMDGDQFHWTRYIRRKDLTYQTNLRRS